MKKFDEELKKIPVMGRDVVRNQPVYSKCDIVGLSNGWVSPEDHQKVVEDLTNARSSITNLTAQLDYYKKDKRFEAMAEEILSLKSQIKKQQPEIPEFMANYIEAAKEDFWTLLSAMDDSNLSSRVGDWLKGGNFRNQEKFAQAWLNGYTVAKEKRYEVVFLEDDTTRQILMENNAGYYFIEEESENYGYWKQDFTEMEIKEINEKFWQLSVPVKDEQIEVEE